MNWLSQHDVKHQTKETKTICEVISIAHPEMNIYQRPLILTAILSRCLINVVYLTACAFIRSWWRCTFWMTSLMAWIDTKIENYVIIASLKRETTGKLINRMPGSHLWYQVYQAQLWEGLLNRSASLTKSTGVLKALPGKLDIKRHSPSILYIPFSRQSQLKSSALLSAYVLR